MVDEFLDGWTDELKDEWMMFWLILCRVYRVETSFRSGQLLP